MSVRKTLFGHDTGKYTIVHDAPIPDIAPDQMLCKTAAVALNPADAKMIDYSPVPGVGGFDFAGYVVQVGDSVSRFKVGDEVFGFVHGLNPDNADSGAFSNFVIATADLCCIKPATMTFQEACTLALALGTVGYAMFELLGLVMPEFDDGQRPEYVLIAGGNTASGRMAMQLLKLSGIKPIVTCNPSNSAALEALGAVETFDYRSSTCGREIKNRTNGKLMHALDCVATADTMTMCFEALGARGGAYVALEAPPTHVKYSRRDVVVDWVQALALFGHPVKLDGTYGRPTSASARRFAAQLYSKAERWAKQGLLQPPNLRICSGGLEGLEEGIEEIRRGRNAGHKLVYPLM